MQQVKDTNIIEVEDPLAALQKIAIYHRSQYPIPVFGITGSNGKTIVKEWMFQLLQEDKRIVRSPRSFNSQIGVPLSVWQMHEKDDIAIFEAGISKKNEMSKLASIIQPTIGVLTNIGDAHDEGFSHREEKLLEKCYLFQHCEVLIYPIILEESIASYIPLSVKRFSWGHNEKATLYVKEIHVDGGHTKITFVYQKQSFFCFLPFVNNMSVSNAVTCIACLLYIEYPISKIIERIQLLTSLEMRMEIKKGVYDCVFINDSYNNDWVGLTSALDYLQYQFKGDEQVLILSDMIHTGMDTEILYQKIACEIKQRKIMQLIAIGEEWKSYAYLFSFLSAYFYTDVDEFFRSQKLLSFQKKAILIKGERRFQFERISSWLEIKKHHTIAYIRLDIALHNLNQFKDKLLPQTKIMAMVKSDSYGSGSQEWVRFLQKEQIDYVGVAYADEGVALRREGIRVPIMVMNTATDSFHDVIEFGLEPEIYSIDFLRNIIHYLTHQGVNKFPIHIKLNTGMNRLGIDTHEVDHLIQELSNTNTVLVRSIFTHLVGGASKECNDFMQCQVQLFDMYSRQIKSALPYPCMTHIANSFIVSRCPDLQYDMVRLGIGLFGEGDTDLHLQPVMQLFTTITQIRWIKANETVSYERSGRVAKDTRVATICIGYGDGYPRQLSNRVGKVWIHNAFAPIIGNICMDMMMIDVTHIPEAKEGDTVELFGDYISLSDIASWANTIPYEILTRIQQRVKKIYVY